MSAKGYQNHLTPGEGFNANETVLNYLTPAMSVT
jgi:hypothetical protein